MKHLFLALATLLSACGGDSTTQQAQKPAYYDVAGYINQQVATLQQQKPAVEKQTTSDGEAQRQTTRTVNWEKELALFAQADINKPALRSSYQITRPDAATYQYTLNPGEDALTVRSLRINVDAVTGRPRQINAVLRTDNPLYSSERQLTLDADAQGNVAHYVVEGFQQLKFRDRQPFRVEGRVLR